MQQQLVFVSLGLCWLILPLPVRSFSRGAGQSACQDLKPGHIRAHPLDPLKSHVTLRTSSPAYLPGQLVTVTVRSSRDFMGFLLQARRVDGLRVMTSDGAKLAATGAGPVVVGGSWALVPPGTHTLHCLSEGDTLTHSDKQLKRNLSFVWKAPNEPIGDIRFYITVVQSYFVYWAGIQSEVVKDKSRALWRRSDTRVNDGLSSTFNHTITADLRLNTTKNIFASIVTEGSTMSPQKKHFSETATGDQQISSAVTSASPRHENQTISSHPEKNATSRSHHKESNDETYKTYSVTKDSNTGTSYTAITWTAAPSTPASLAFQEKLRDDIWGLNNSTDFDMKDKTQNLDTAWNHRDDTTPSTSKNSTHKSQYQTSPLSLSSNRQFLEQESDNNESLSQSYILQTTGELDTTSQTSAETSDNLFTIVHGSTDSSTNLPKYSMSTSSSQTGTVLSPTQVSQHSPLSNRYTAQAVTAKPLLHSNHTSPSLGLLLQPQTSITLYERLLKRNPLQTKSDTSQLVQRPSPQPKFQTSSEIFDSTWRQAQSSLATTLPPTKDTGLEHDLLSQTEKLYAFNLTSESLDTAVDAWNQTKLETSFLSTSMFTSPPLKATQYSTTAFSQPPPPSPIAMPPISSSVPPSDYQKPFSILAPSSRPVNASSTPASLLPVFSSSSSTTSSASSARVVSSSSLYRSSSFPFTSSSPPSRVIWKSSASSLLFGPSVPSTHSTSVHPGPSPALRRTLNDPSQIQTDSESAKQTPELHLNPKPHPNPNPEFNVKIGNSFKPNAPKMDTKVPPKFETPDTGGKYPDIIPRHPSWEVGMLLGCSVGLGMMLVFGVRYMYRQACGKRTEVTLNDRERRYATGERGLIHVQECGDLVRVRRLRENSFVLLAEYDILASTGD